MDVNTKMTGRDGIDSASVTSGVEQIADVSGKKQIRIAADESAPSSKHLLRAIANYGGDMEILVSSGHLPIGMRLDDDTPLPYKVPGVETLQMDKSSLDDGKVLEDLIPEELVEGEYISSEPIPEESVYSKLFGSVKEKINLRNLKYLAVGVSAGLALTAIVASSYQHNPLKDRKIVDGFLASPFYYANKPTKIISVLEAEIRRSEGYVNAIDPETIQGSEAMYKERLAVMGTALNLFMFNCKDMPKMGDAYSALDNLVNLNYQIGSPYVDQELITPQSTYSVVSAICSDSSSSPAPTPKLKAVKKRKGLKN